VMYDYQYQSMFIRIIKDSYEIMKSYRLNIATPLRLVEASLNVPLHIIYQQSSIQ